MTDDPEHESVADDSSRNGDDEAEDHAGVATEERVDAPLADLAASVAEAEAATEDPIDDDLFDREPVTEIDSDRLWERLESDEPTETLFDEGGREEREIDAHRYCQQCEYFANPPVVECTHEGTEILDVPAHGRFRVVDCPVILEEEELERQY